MNLYAFSNCDRNVLEMSTIGNGWGDKTKISYFCAQEILRGVKRKSQFLVFISITWITDCVLKTEER